MVKSTAHVFVEILTKVQHACAKELDGVDLRVIHGLETKDGDVWATCGRRTCRAVVMDDVETMGNAIRRHCQYRQAAAAAAAVQRPLAVIEVGLEVTAAWRRRRRAAWRATAQQMDARQKASVSVRVMDIASRMMGRISASVIHMPLVSTATFHTGETTHARTIAVEMGGVIWMVDALTQDLAIGTRSMRDVIQVGWVLRATRRTRLSWAVLPHLHHDAMDMVTATPRTVLALTTSIPFRV